MQIFPLYLNHGKMLFSVVLYLNVIVVYFAVTCAPTFAGGNALNACTHITLTNSSKTARDKRTSEMRSPQDSPLANTIKHKASSLSRHCIAEQTNGVTDDLLAQHTHE